LDAGAIVALGNEPHLDLTGLGGIALDLPGQADVPADHHPVGRLVDKHACPPTLAAVGAAVVDVAALAWLKHHLGERGPKDVVVRGPPTPDLLGEYRERALERRLDGDRLPRAGGCVLHGHVTSSSYCSTASLNAVNA